MGVAAHPIPLLWPHLRGGDYLWRGHRERESWGTSQNAAEHNEWYCCELYQLSIFHKMSLFNHFTEPMNVFLGTRCCRQNPTQKKAPWKKPPTSSHSALRSVDMKGSQQ